MNDLSQSVNFDQTKLEQILEKNQRKKENRARISGIKNPGPNPYDYKAGMPR